MKAIQIRLSDTEGKVYRWNIRRVPRAVPKASELQFNQDGTVTFYPGTNRSWTLEFIEQA